MVDFEDWFFRYNGWSYSKHRLFQLCKRSFYYRYVGTALKESKIFDIKKLKRLKDLNSKYALEGLLIHNVIENQIGQHYLGRTLNEEGAKAQYRLMVERYRMTSQDMLVEFYNGLPQDDLFFNKIRDEGQEKICMFFGVIWPQLRDLEYLKHEDFDKFKIKNVEVIVKVDYVSKTKNDVIVITDWKTGSDDERYENDLQIGTYVLWAMDYYNKGHDQIRSELAYLKTGMMHPYEFSSNDLEKIQFTVLDDFTKMNESYEISAYPASPEGRKCMSCQFGSICPESLLRIFLSSLSDEKKMLEY
jgi:CRISPR/Cas system-associated exonuclease Cas4 (RecB family)